jgi:molecular chaperone DnaJ
MERFLARDYYEILGLSRKCSQRDIKKAFHQLAREFHPDITGNDVAATERFKEISEAYEVLSDPQKRRRYDLFGGPARGPSKSETHIDPIEKLQDIIGQVGQIFKRSPTAPSPGVDTDKRLSISFAESYTGVKKKIEVTLPRPCSICDGKGHISREAAHPCPDCHGSGKSSPFDFLPMGLRCQTCQGSGTVTVGPCRGCHSQGHRIQKETLWVQIPAGVQNGARIRLKNRGQAGTRGGPAGDLYVAIDIEPDSRFGRRGSQLTTRARIGLREALVGGEVAIPLPAGEIRLKIPPETQGGHVFRISNRGFPRPSKKIRDTLYVRIEIQIPKDLGPEEKSWLEKL